MPLVRGIRVLVVHIFCSPDGLASQPLRKRRTIETKPTMPKARRATTMMVVHHMLTTSISRYILLSLRRRLHTVLWITRGPTRSLVGH